jgi:hypothetical protein
VGERVLRREASQHVSGLLVAVIEIDEVECDGLDCLPATLERWLRDPAALW